MKTLLLFSALCFLSITTLKAQVPNNGFEDWENDLDGNWNPKFWITSNSTPDTSVHQYTPGYAGNFSMQVAAFTPGGGFIIPGMARIDYPSNERPTQITISMRSTVAPGDIILVYYSSWRNDTMIAAVGDCSFNIDSTMGMFHTLTFPIVHTRDIMIPDTAQVMILAGSFANAQLGTNVIIDEIILSGIDNGINYSINLSPATLHQNFPNPTSNTSIIPITLTHHSNVCIKIFDVQGREIKKVIDDEMNAGTHSVNLPTDDLVKGVYYYNAVGKDFNLSKKFVVN